MWETLFSYDKRGKVKTWNVDTLGDEIIVTHGLLGGKKQTKRTIAKPKNVGRANATTGAEQAKLEAQSKWNKQCDKNYHVDLDDYTPTLNPMLAYDYHKHGHLIKFPAHLQLKLDGVRCLVKYEDGKIVFKSRGGKYYPLIPEIVVQIETLLGSLHPDMVLDGELYIHGKFLQEIVSAVKKPNAMTPLVTFEIFDVAVEGIKWEDRVHTLTTIQDIVKTNKLDRINIVTTMEIRHKDFLEGFHDAAVDGGYEGIMIRNIEGFYQYDHRSTDLQKYKRMVREEFEIVGHKVDKDGHIVWEVKVSDTVTCEVTPACSHELREQLLAVATTFYGKALTVQFQGYTMAGSLQFPVGVELDRTDHEDYIITRGK